MGFVVFFGALLLLASYNYAATQTPVATTKAPRHTIPLRLPADQSLFLTTTHQPLYRTTITFLPTDTAKPVL